MHSWSQWGPAAAAAAAATSAYPLGFPPAGALATPGVTPAPAVPTMPYPISGYQWPNYTTSAATPTPPAPPNPAVVPPAPGAWPGVTPQHQQQWDQWTQWQQQYSQWHLQYGEKYLQAMQQGGAASTQVTTATTTAIASSAPPPVPAVSSAAPPPPSGPYPSNSEVPSSNANKRPSESPIVSQEAKKAKSDGSKGPIKDTLEELTEAEKQFDEQFKSWEEQFNKWREQNANHPDTTQYKAYEAKWENWREQLLQRREAMKKKREAKLAELAKEGDNSSEKSTSLGSSTMTSSTSTVTTSMASLSAPTNTLTSQTPLVAGQPYPTVPSAYGYYGQQYGYPPPVYPGGMSQASIAGNPMAGLLPVPGQPGGPTPVPPVMNSSFPMASSNDQKGGKKASEGGIPGLDLIGGGGPNSSQYPSMTLPPLNPEPIQTPADSKPFDFPPPNTNPHNNSKKMGYMNIPPPGYMSSSNFKINPLVCKPSDFSLPPPAYKVNPNKEVVESLMNSFSQKKNDQGGRDYDYDDGTEDSRYDLNSWDGKKHWQDKNSPGGDHFGARDKFPPGGGNRMFDSPFDPNFDGPRNNFKGGGPNNQLQPPPNFDNPPPRFQGGDGSPMKPSLMGMPPPNFQNRDFQGSPSKKPGLLETPSMPSRHSRFSNREPNEGPFGSSDEPPFESNEEPYDSNERPPYDANDEPPYNSNEGSFDGNRGPPFDVNRGPPFHGNRFQPNFNERMGMGPPHMNDMPPEENENYDSGRPPPDNIAPPAKNELPSYRPVKVIDYEHGRANLVIPPFYEPHSMIEYAHGANTIMEGEVVSRNEHSREFWKEEAGREGKHRDMWGDDDDRSRRRRDRDRGSRWGGDPGRDHRSREDDEDDRRFRDSRGRGRNDERGRGDRRRSREDSNRGRDERGRDDRGRDERGREDRMRDERRDDRTRDDRGMRGRDDRRDERGRDRRDEPGRGWERDDKMPDDRWRSDKGRLDSDERGRRGGDSDDRRRGPPSDRNQGPFNDKIEPFSELNPVPEAPKKMVVLVDDLLDKPGRDSRPSKIAIILRGPPGSGKTYLAKLLKDREVEMGGSAPRILSLDDYFMTEVEKEEVDKESGKKIKQKVMEYEFEAGLEKNYRESLVKSFKKTIQDGYFNFIIVDCINDKLGHFEEMSTFAKQKGFQVYICDMDLDLQLSLKRNIHNRSENDIQSIIDKWEETPITETSLDTRSLLQSAAITEVNMDDAAQDESPFEETPVAEEATNEETSKTALQEEDEKDEPVPNQTGWTASPKPAAHPPPQSRTGFNFPRMNSPYQRNPQPWGRRGFGGQMWRRGDNRRR